MDQLIKEKEMKCIVCKGSNIELKDVNEQIQFKDDIVLLPLRVLVCSTCGERYYDRQTLKRIEEIRSKIANRDFQADEVGKVLRVRAA
jgi:YgiT-type zinc finger domain-containing protein